jgi:hypothetical protein
MYAKKIRIKYYTTLPSDIIKWRRQGFQGHIIIYKFFK